MARRLVLKMSMSLDGFVAGPNGEMEWMLRSRGPDGKAWVAETIARAGVHALGSRSFLAMAGFWATANDPLAEPMNAIPKVVFTRRPSLDIAGAMGAAAALPTAASWLDAQIASGDLASEIARLKEQPGNDILAHGGAGFARSLVRLGLVDEYRLVVHPVVLGSGLPIFTELAKPADLVHVSTTVFGLGGVGHVYRPA